MVTQARKDTRRAPRRKTSTQDITARITLGRDGAFYTWAHPNRRRDAGTGSQPSPKRRGDGMRALASPIAPEHLEEASPGELMDSLNRAYARTPVLTLLLGVAFAVALVAGISFGSSWGAAVAFGATALVVLPCAHRGESSGHTVAVEYRLDGDAARSFRKVTEAFQRFARCRAVWHVQRKGAAKGHRVIRRRIRPRVGLPPRLRSNLRVPALRAGRQRLYFFPDRVLVYDAQMVWAVPYPDLKVEAAQVHVGDSGRASREPKGNGATGGTATPARPGVNGLVRLRSSTGLSEMFQCSSPQAAADFAAAVASLKEAPRAADGTAPVKLPA
jgi:hypothetical protein